VLRTLLCDNQLVVLLLLQLQVLEEGALHLSVLLDESEGLLDFLLLPLCLP
jgi:hypothetical protein